MIIQRAEISMVIKDTEATATAIRTLALNVGPIYRRLQPVP